MLQVSHASSTLQRKMVVHSQLTLELCQVLVLRGNRLRKLIDTHEAEEAVQTAAADENVSAAENLHTNRPRSSQMRFKKRWSGALTSTLQRAYCRV
jgi:hypothetical protein